MSRVNIGQETSRILLDIKAVTFDIEKPYRYASGMLSPVYVDNRLLISHTREREKIINYFCQKIKENDIKADFVAGMATSGIPFAAWLSERLNLPMIYVRGVAKNHGKKNLIEGTSPHGRVVLMVEDLISTGTSSINGIISIRNNGGIVKDCLSIFTYKMKKSMELFTKENVRLLALADIDTLLSVATEKGYINLEEKSIVLEWIKNPYNWGQRMGFE